MSLLPLLHVAGFQQGNRLSKSRELASALQETSSFLKGRWAGPKHEANNVAADPTTRSLVYIRLRPAITGQMQVERHNNQHGVWFQTCAILILLVMRFT